MVTTDARRLTIFPKSYVHLKNANPSAKTKAELAQTLDEELELAREYRECIKLNPFQLTTDQYFE